MKIKCKKQTNIATITSKINQTQVDISATRYADILDKMSKLLFLHILLIFLDNFRSYKTPTNNRKKKIVNRDIDLRCWNKA